MGVRKWLMKQQWRLVQIRSIWGLFYGILLLAVSYYGYFPYFADMGSWGPLVFAGVILFSFLILGYIYDVVLVMWAPSNEVNIERNPFQYVPAPKDRVFWFPFFASVLDASEKILEKMDLETSEVVETRKYFAELQRLRPERNDDLDRGIELRQEYMKKYRFEDIPRETDTE